MKKENRSVFKAWVMVTQVGITFLTPIGLCVIAGYYLDKHFKTSCWFIILFFLGVLAAFRNVYVMTKSFYEKDLKRENEELEYWKHFTTEDKSSWKNSKSENGTDKE
ncbi:AtpZ/AtpI family protein [[Clostridium] polysaccharolyticum]|jgi:F0F1-type ATP synthase assembly protein I|uniref:Putative F0F1-ATPase subunit Ca2+/Mg2+ transporter n=1 Tax=[Clostridium] polysaccharolyticum TaxID=29364 RepID=A0A1I0BSE7_9FIRM|nr:AtpZ/AtpI family protein [[Clostridium] polysaccharolyticum]SET09229.1 Putative F0F1-ATPase subunit Ca2+/Mg2+ transporter [[Clostridium] polysaccharolyticum]